MSKNKNNKEHLLNQGHGMPTHGLGRGDIDEELQNNPSDFKRNSSIFGNYQNHQSNNTQKSKTSGSNNYQDAQTINDKNGNPISPIMEKHHNLKT